MKIYLTVKYEESYKVKELGAEWDPYANKWCVHSGDPYVSELMAYMPRQPEHLHHRHKLTPYEIEFANRNRQMTKAETRKAEKAKLAERNRQTLAKNRAALYPKQAPRVRVAEDQNEKEMRKIM